eukprot:TRINITY_DN2595_c0_g1_i2.p1 TRINITY_DN2595_c0_g1~~TRINITY_DN2595_c0_g1_i2.p1  ORF type:complete len:162 (+),score=12.93 TRINITY_DN2595_c0_g1_i2:164-649(+)
MEGLLHLSSLQVDPELTTGVFCTGDYNLIQKEAIRHRGRDLRYSASPLVDPHSYSPHNFDFSRILMSYQSRNLSMRLDNSYCSQLRSGELRTFIVNLHTSFPEQMITYRPGFWQVLKWAWVQYAAILIVFMILFRTIKGFVFSNQVLPSTKQVPQMHYKQQ